MAIGSAIQKGKFIHLYDERGRQIRMIPGDELLGWTGSAVTIRRNTFAHVFDEKGRQLSLKSMR